MPEYSRTRRSGIVVGATVNAIVTVLAPGPDATMPGA